MTLGCVLSNAPSGSESAKSSICCGSTDHAITETAHSRIINVTYRTTQGDTLEFGTTDLPRDTPDRQAYKMLLGPVRPKPCTVTRLLLGTQKLDPSNAASILVAQGQRNLVLTVVWDRLEDLANLLHGVRYLGKHQVIRREGKLGLLVTPDSTACPELARTPITTENIHELVEKCSLMLIIPYFNASFYPTSPEHTLKMLEIIDSMPRYETPPQEINPQEVDAEIQQWLEKRDPQYLIEETITEEGKTVEIKKNGYSGKINYINGEKTSFEVCFYKGKDWPTLIGSCKTKNGIVFLSLFTSVLPNMGREQA